MYRLLISALSIFFCVSVSAVEVTDLYQDILVVEDKSRDARLDASRKALLNVLVKVSGDKSADENQIAQQRTKDISDYMLKFEYDERIPGTLKLLVKFEARKINALIKDLNLPLWGAQRPLVAIWLGIEDNRQRELVTQESYPQLEQLIYDKASRRGLPVVVPLLDLQDRRLVGVPEVWGNFSGPVEEASKRYSAERSITARMYQEFNSDNWVLDWRFTNDEMFESNRIIGYRQQIVAQMIDDLAQGLAGEYAIDPNAYYEQRTANLTLKGTDNFVDIELAKRRLLNLSVVTQAVIIRKTPDSVEFELHHTGTVSDLKKALGLDNAFKDYVDPSAFYHIVDEQSLEYQWVVN
ncbi:DUF2066 domain-containing protein [Pseudoalteromonas tetraodonis]|uniref:DUF2066 domain-containing protein n=1 Tax=Pseudoalteromonas tetraodonis TaxID=43659 RepID=UPI003CFD417B